MLYRHEVLDMIAVSYVGRRQPEEKVSEYILGPDIQTAICNTWPIIEVAATRWMDTG